MTDMVPMPARGRVFRTRRRVRLADANPHGRLRLDALARYLQDIASEDAADAGVERRVAWVVRRTAVELVGEVRYGEEVELATFCGGLGGRWAERRTVLVGASGRIDAASLWVALDPSSGRPVPLEERFVEVYGEAAGGRRVSGRLTHGDRPLDAAARAWPLRATDFDVLGHVNNAAYWQAVEDETSLRGKPAAVARAELEYRAPIEPGDEVELASVADEGAVRMWLTGGRGLHASAVVLGD